MKIRLEFRGVGQERRAGIKEQAAEAGSDGLIIMRDGTKYVSSVRLGGVSQIKPNRPAELIATGIPSAASMCFDPEGNQLVIPMTRTTR